MLVQFIIHREKLVAKNITPVLNDVLHSVVKMGHFISKLMQNVKRFFKK